MAVISSMTWLTGWMRPVSSGDGRTGRVTSTASSARRRARSCVLEHGAAGGERLADAVLQAVERRPHDLALVRRHGAERLQQLGDDALLAERGDAHGLERRLVGGRGDAFGDVALERGDIGFGRGHVSACPGPSGLAFNRKPGRGQAPPVTGRAPGNPARRQSRRRFFAKAQAASAPAALSTSALNAAGSLMASSARTLRSISTPALPRPSINRP